MPPPTNIDVAQLLAKHPRWSLQTEGLVADFAFPSYMAGVEFVNRVAGIAESMNHHPDIRIGWRNVRLSIMTHSKNAITSLDADFVGRVEADCAAVGGSAS